MLRVLFRPLEHQLQHEIDARPILNLDPPQNDKTGPRQALPKSRYFSKSMINQSIQIDIMKTINS
jgi:hypothetical protein